MIFDEKLDTKIHFANPYAYWKRGINENIKGLIKQYSLSGKNFNKISNLTINFISDRVNDRFRKTLHGKPPNELFKGIRIYLLAA
ncbi:hypothetical protein [Photorhabdus heterorhabditis]|uniref:hypothetical protein n=1 Tax=Photorhabdus heterorhabditis TaxID=880156 RepID=UPI0015626F90|nr:hypothetical protein [Photorhabdus heterorhabditis subsp. aluminescens]